VRRGILEYSEWKENRNGRFPIRARMKPNSISSPYPIDHTPTPLASSYSCFYPQWPWFGKNYSELFALVIRKQKDELGCALL
jgi:hypothetical protein